jgi:hypothetical protein
MSQVAEFWPSALDRVPVSYTALTVLPRKPLPGGAIGSLIVRFIRAADI